MERSADQEPSGRRPSSGFGAKLFSAFGAAAKLPFQLAATLLKRLVQIIFSIFIVILHPGFKWLLALLTRSRFVRDYIRPVLQELGARVYEPYFAFLRGLPPYVATVSIAVPLAVLEPAKLYATILIAQKPKAGILLWLFLQGLSFVLIDKTWTAVRPQSRKIWIVSRLHAWGWLNLSYGKYWITSSAFYQAMIRSQKQVRSAAKAYWQQLVQSLRRWRVRHEDR
jgi:hypothetical protein